MRFFCVGFFIKYLLLVLLEVPLGDFDFFRKFAEIFDKKSAWQCMIHPVTATLWRIIHCGMATWQSIIHHGMTAPLCILLRGVFAKKLFCYNQFF